MIVVQKERWHFQARRWFVQTSFLLLRFLFLGACLGSACGEGGGEHATVIKWPQQSRSAAKIGAQLIGKSDFISGGYTSGDIFSCFHG